jgi:simple sugar transport system permease protein
MAIVIAMLARGKPLGVVIGSFLFGITISLGTALQAAGVTSIPDNFIHALPFVAIMLSLILFVRRSYLPPALALPYVRGAR